MLLVIYDQIFKVTPFASFLQNNVKLGGLSVPVEDLIMYTQSGCLLFSPAAAQQSLHYLSQSRALPKSNTGKKTDKKLDFVLFNIMNRKYLLSVY